MSDHPERRRQAPRSSATRKTSRNNRGASGQAIVEYALIAVLVCVAIAAVVAATGPAIGNIFSNTVYNLLGQKFTPEPTMGRDQIFTYAARIAGYTHTPPVYNTNTPLAPTCKPPRTPGTWAPVNDLGTWQPC